MIKWLSLLSIARGYKIRTYSQKWQLAGKEKQMSVKKET